MSFLRSIHREAWLQILLYGFLATAVLWRGGKSIDVTWVLTGVTFAVVVCSHVKNKKLKPVPWLVWLPVISIVLWTFASYAQSTTSNYGIDELLRTTSFALLFLWAVRFVQKEEGRLIEHGITNFVRIVSIVTVIACAIGVVVYIFQPVNRFVGTFFDARFHTDYWPNAWASYLLLTWPVVYYWVLSQWKAENTRAQRTTSFLLRSFVLALLLATMFLSYSRGGLIALGGQLALWGGMTYIQIKDKQTWSKIAVCTLGVFALAGMFFLSANAMRSDLHDVISLEEKVTFTADEGTSSVSERSAFWKQALQLSFDRPLFGWGPYSFRFVQPHVQVGVLATSDHPHNIFLKMAMETGWPAAILFLFLLGVIFMRTIDVELQKERKLAPIGTLLLIGVAGTISHSLIDYNMQFVGIALPFWLMLGFLAGHAVRTSDRTVSLPLARSVELFLATIIVCIALYEGVFLVTSSIGRHAESVDDYRKALVWYERSMPEHFSRDLHLSRTNIHIANKEFTTAERTLWDYMAVNQQDYRVWKLQGQIYEGMYQFKKAADAYEMAYEYGKYNDIGILHGLVLSYVNSNQSDMITARKNEFDALIQQYGQAILRNAHFIALSPNVEQFIELCDVFADLYPDEAPVYIVLAARADDHSAVERQRIQSRAPGFLW